LKRVLLPLVYLLTLAIDIIYTIQVVRTASQRPWGMEFSELIDTILIAFVIGGLWALENIAIVYIKKAET